MVLIYVSKYVFYCSTYESDFVFIHPNLQSKYVV